MGRAINMQRDLDTLKIDASSDGSWGNNVAITTLKASTSLSVDTHPVNKTVVSIRILMLAVLYLYNLPCLMDSLLPP